MRILCRFLGKVSSIHHGLELIRAVSIAAMVWWAYYSARVRLFHDSGHLIVLISRLSSIKCELEVSAIPTSAVHYNTRVRPALILRSDWGFHHSIASKGKSTLRDRRS